MPRKNSRVRRSNDKGRLSRRQHEQLPKPPQKQPKIKIEDIVLPDGQCRFQSPRRPKARFSTQARADKALIQTQQKRASSGSGHVEKRVYECPQGGCGGFHLTSRETFDEALSQRRYQQRSGA